MTLPRALRLLTLAALAFLASIAIGGFLASPAGAIYDDSDADSVIDLAEVIAGSDPNDASSVPEDAGTEFFLGSAFCRDGRDNDGDGAIDNLDTGCRDSDLDVISDPMETILGSNPNNGTSFPEDARLDTVLDYYGISIFACADGVDNDGDGATDGADAGCAPLGDDGDSYDDFTEKRYGSDPTDPNSVPEHNAVNPGSCTDGVDNDGDGMTDGADPACSTPANDNRVAAVAITSLPYTDGPSVMKNASVEPGEPRASCVIGGATASVWYRYTAGADETVVADTRGSNFETTIAVYHNTGAGLSEVACTAYLPGGRAIFDAEAGETYDVQIGGFPFAQGIPLLAFNAAIGHPPANDSFLTSTIITSLPFADSADLTTARTEFGEPAPSCGTISGAATVWYRYEATDDTLLVLDTEGSDFVSFIGVWTETIFGLGPVTCASPSQLGEGARAGFRAQPGRVYYFQVGRFSFNIPGLFNGFHLEFLAEAVDPLPNDDFSGATQVGTLPFHGQSEALTISLEPGEPSPSCMFYERPVNSVWYRYTPPSDTILLATSEGGSFDSYLAIYTGASLADLSEVGCASPDFPFAEFALEATGGETYYFQAGKSEFVNIIFAQPEGTDSTGEPSGFPSGDPTTVYFNLASVPLPPCPAPQFTVQDPLGDIVGPITFGGSAGFGPGDFYRPDVSSVSGGSDTANFCMTIQFDNPIDPPNQDTERSLSGFFGFDADSNRSTGGFTDVDFLCPEPSGIRIEARITLFSASGALVPISPSGPGGGQQQYAIARYGERSMTLIIPLAAIGGDDVFDFAFAIGAQGPISDCVPNSGAVRSPAGTVISFRPRGDVNCNNSAGPVDATLILQYSAGMIAELPCQEAGDVNGDGRIDPLDASLLLQVWADLIPALP